MGPIIFKYGRVKWCVPPAQEANRNQMKLTERLARTTNLFTTWLDPRLWKDPWRVKLNSIKITFSRMWRLHFSNIILVFFSSIYSVYFLTFGKTPSEEIKIDSVDKLTKMKFLNQENFNYIRKHPNHENFSRCKSTRSQNLGK